MVLSIDPKLVLSLTDVFSIILVTMIFIIVIVVLVLINKKLDKKIKDEEEKALKYENKINEIKALKPTLENLDKLTKVAKEFFKEKYNLGQNLTYLELADKFKKMKNEEEKVKFCQNMSDLLYSGRKIKPEEIKKVIDIFSEIIEKAESND